MHRAHCSSVPSLSQRSRCRSQAACNVFIHSALGRFLSSFFSPFLWSFSSSFDKITEKLYSITAANTPPIVDPHTVVESRINLINSLSKNVKLYFSVYQNLQQGYRVVRLLLYAGKCLVLNKWENTPLSIKHRKKTQVRYKTSCETKRWDHIFHISQKSYGKAFWIW